jgi:hypothetical protein
MKGIWIAFLVLAACNPSAERAVSKIDPVQTTEVSQTTKGREREIKVADEPNITIGSVEVGNPLVVAGLARTFENNVVFRARAADGTVIAESFTTSTGEMGQHNPYSGSLWLTREPGSRIVVEALEYSARDGAETNLIRTEKPFDVEPIEAVLVFPDENCTGMKTITRRMPKSISMARLLVEALIQGPTEEERRRGAAAAFPEGAAVQSVILRDGALTVDFNERLQNVGGSCRAQMIRTSVTETIRKLPTVRKVLITAGGSDKLALQP